MNRFTSTCIVLFFVSVGAFVGEAQANIPSAYFACEGATEGDHCQTLGPRYGNCVLDTLCEDPPDTDVNECLLCVDGCWGSEPGDDCVRRDGSEGVCVMNTNCTTDPNKSFQQCNRCSPIRNESAATGEDAGCHSINAFAVSPWILILGLLAASRRPNQSHQRSPSGKNNSKRS